MSPPPYDRVMARVEKSDECWLWTGPLNAKGYGCVYAYGKRRPVHAIVWEHSNGPVPAGLEMDHLCRVRNCVRPDHLEAVTHAENLRRRLPPKPRPRKVVCRRDHRLSGANVLISTNPRTGRARQRCRACAELSRQKYRSTRPSAAQSAA